MEAGEHPASAYPVTFSMEYPERDLNRLTTAFRIFTVIPIAVILAGVVGAGGPWSSETGGWFPLAAPGC